MTESSPACGFTRIVRSPALCRDTSCRSASPKEGIMPVVTKPVRIVLHPRSAAEMMSPNPMSIQAETTVAEAVAVLTDRGYCAAPVIDEAGRPIGVLSRADLL